MTDKRTWAFPNIKNEVYRFEADEEKGEWIINGIRSDSCFKARDGENMVANGICEEVTQNDTQVKKNLTDASL